MTELEKLTNLKTLLKELEKITKEASLLIDYINVNHPEIMKEAIYQCILKDKYGTRK